MDKYQNTSLCYLLDLKNDMVNTVITARAPPTPARINASWCSSYHGISPAAASSSASSSFFFGALGFFLLTAAVADEDGDDDEETEEDADGDDGDEEEAPLAGEGLDTEETGAGPAALLGFAALAAFADGLVVAAAAGAPLLPPPLPFVVPNIFVAILLSFFSSACFRTVHAYRSFFTEVSIAIRSS